MTARLTEKDAARFWKKVDIKSKDECWPWQASTGTNGYGQFGVKAGDKMKVAGAHRVAYCLHYGVWPDAARHQCSNPVCCNPKHIFDPAAPTRASVTSLRALHSQSRHSDAEIRQMRELYAKGNATQAQLAQRYGAAQPWIGQVVRGECRKKAGGPITAFGRGRRAA